MKKNVLTFAFSLLIITITNAQLSMNSLGHVGVGTTGSDVFTLSVYGHLNIPSHLSVYISDNQQLLDRGTRLRLSTNTSNAYLDYSTNLYMRYGANASYYGAIFHSNGYMSLNSFYNYNSPSTYVPTYPLEVNGYIQVNGTVLPSDGRFKENIESLTNNSDKLKKLTSVKYDYKKILSVNQSVQVKSVKGNSLDTIDSKDTSTTNIITKKFDDITTSRKHFGFVAQDLQKIFPELVYADNEGYLSVDYISLIPILVASFQEQSQTIDNQATDIASLKQQVSDLQTNLTSCCNLKGGKLKSDNVISDETTNPVIGSTNIKLYQNAPNPFKSSTTIKMDIPQTTGNAMVCIYDLNGRQLKCLPVSGKGTTSVEIYGSELTAGLYHYALIVDGSLIDTKTMVLTE